MENEALIRKWLYMETMNFALGIVRGHYQHSVYKDSESSRFVPFEEFMKNILTYAVENWNVAEINSYTGRASSHGRYSIGCWIISDTKGLSSKYEGIEIFISWMQVNAFIKKMLIPVEKDRQINLLELLAQEAT